MIFFDSLSKFLNKIRYRNRLASAKVRLLGHEKPFNLHVGCGSIKLNHWINIDINDQESIVDITWDATSGFPFIENESCSLIYNEHFLEHLTPEESKIFLKDCYRILEQDGVLRIAMPSLEYTVEKYQSDNWRDQDWLTWPEYKFIETRAEMLNIAMRWWGHQWLYDREELHRRLKEAGFTIIRDMEWGESSIPELKNLETRKDSILICEAQKNQV